MVATVDSVNRGSAVEGAPGAVSVGEHEEGVSDRVVVFVAAKHEKRTKTKRV